MRNQFFVSFLGAVWFVLFLILIFGFWLLVVFAAQAATETHDMTILDVDVAEHMN